MVRGRPGAGVRLHLHDPTVQADQGHRVRAGEAHWSPIPVMCTSTGCWSRCSSTPMASSRRPSTWQAVLAQPLGRELAEPPHLRVRDRLQRVAVVATGAALDLAEHRRPPAIAAIQRDHVELTPAAGPVPVEDLQTLSFQLERRQGLPQSRRSRCASVAPSRRLHLSSPHWGRRTETTGVIRRSVDDGIGSSDLWISPGEAKSASLRRSPRSVSAVERLRRRSPTQADELDGDRRSADGTGGPSRRLRKRRHPAGTAATNVNRRKREPAGASARRADTGPTRHHADRQYERSGQVGLGTSRSLCAISSMETSRKVSTLALFTNRAGRYMSQTQASAIDTS